MRVSLVGADLEENLGLGMISAALQAAGHRVDVVPFNDAAEAPRVMQRVMAGRPGLIGLGIQFQHRAHDFLSLARCLRSRGYGGHITCGGHFSTMAYREILQNDDPVSSIVLHDGEHSVVELAQALATGRSVQSVPGLALRSSEGPSRTDPRPLRQDLDGLPMALRYREHSRHLGVPFIPVWGSRGCWGRCAFCSISTFFRDAQGYGGGRKLRLRSPENVAAEMALLWHRAGGSAIFCFHDDTFLLPRPADSIARVRAIRSELDALGVGRTAMIGKCRPECLTLDLARELRELGVIRLYVGVENASQHGQDDLCRRTRAEDVDRAIGILQQAGIFGCYNLLLFEPDATLDDVRENIAFMRRHAENPVNFCRAEPYHGTPLHQSLERRGLLGGSYLGWDYRLHDDRTELLFRICSAAFRERNFHPRGVANRYMGLGYLAQILEFFHTHALGERDALIARARQFTREVSGETAGFLEEALQLTQSVELDDRDRIERETALLGLRIAAHDRVWHAAFDELVEDMRAYAGERPADAPRPKPPQRLREVVRNLTLAGALAFGAAHCGGETDDTGWPGSDAATDAGTPDDASTDVTVVDMVPPDAGWYDPLPPDAAWADPVPLDAGQDVMVVDMVPPDAGWDDPLPPDAGVVIDAASDAPTDAAQDVLPDIMVVDMVPPDAGWYDPLPPDAPWADPPPPDGGTAENRRGPEPEQSAPLDHWQNTAPRRAARSDHLPLFDPPVVKLDVRPSSDCVEVSLRGGPDAISVRWEARGQIEGTGRDVRWRPDGPDDQLRAGVRSAGGVAVVSVFAGSLPGLST